MVNNLVDPVQEVLPFVKVGVTTIVATTGDVPELVAVNAEISPEPLSARPILVVLFVQVYVVVPPVFAVVKMTAPVLVLLHTTWLDGWVT